MAFSMGSLSLNRYLGLDGNPGRDPIFPIPMHLSFPIVWPAHTSNETFNHIVITLTTVARGSVANF